MCLCTYSALLPVILTVLFQYGVFGLQDVTADLFGADNKGTVAAFGDFNSDKQTDVFVIRDDSELVIFLADVKVPYFKPKVHVKKDAFPSGVSVISSVVPADYDGDSQMDVLLTGHASADLLHTSVFVFWGNNQTLNQSSSVDLNRTFKDQPLVME
ncbi:T-cell immunomodulatory protein [Tachysurus ichikawai]